MADRPKVEQLLASLRRYVGVLRGLAQTSEAAFLASGDKIGNAKYHFVVAIECCVDIANHIIASEGFRIPKHNADSFTVLTEQAILPADRVVAFQAMARFRNRLVHMYWEVDDEAVFAYLRSNLDDFDVFEASIGAMLARSEQA